MKNHFIDEVNVIIDGSSQQMVTITGAGHNPNIVKSKAIEIVKESHPNSKLAAIIVNHRQVSVEEYREQMGSNPPWFGRIE